MDVPSDENAGSQLIAIAGSFMAIETLFVSLRYFSRYISKARLEVDDWLMMPALIFNYCLCLTSIFMVIEGGAGRHFSWLLVYHKEYLIKLNKLKIPFIMSYSLAVTFPKLVILFMYLRIFVEKRDRYITFIIIGIVSSSCLVVVVLSIVQCQPIAYLWNPKGYPGGRCIDLKAFSRWGSFPNLITDFVMLFVPLPCILKLKLSKKDKIGLMLTFLTGSVGMVTSAIRFSIFFSTNDLADPSFASIKFGSIGIAEAGVYIIAACLPTYRKLFQSVLARYGLSGVAGSRNRPRDTELVSISGTGTKKGQVFNGRSTNGFHRLVKGEENTLFSPDQGNESFQYEASSTPDPEFGSQIRVRRDFEVSSAKFRSV